MTHQWVNVFDLGDNSTKKWVQKIHMGTFTYSDEGGGGGSRRVEAAS